MPKLTLTPATVNSASCPTGKRKIDLFDMPKLEPARLVA